MIWLFGACNPIITQIGFVSPGLTLERENDAHGIPTYGASYQHGQKMGPPRYFCWLINPTIPNKNQNETGVRPLKSSQPASLMKCPNHHETPFENPFSRNRCPIESNPSALPLPSFFFWISRGASIGCWPLATGWCFTSHLANAITDVLYFFVGEGKYTYIVCTYVSMIHMYPWYMCTHNVNISMCTYIYIHNACL